VIQLSARPNSDSGTYQVRFSDGTLKWMDDSACKIHLYNADPRLKMKLTPEIFEEDPRAVAARLKGQLGAGRYSSLGPRCRKTFQRFFWNERGTGAGVRVGETKSRDHRANTERYR
jgi:hypothetical protein